MKKRFVSTILILIAITLTACQPSAPADIIVTLGESRPIAPDFLGFNGNLVSLDQPWDDADFLAAFEKTHAGNLRYPGGGIANYWDWDIGWIDQNTDEKQMIAWMWGLQASSHRYPLENLVKVVAETNVSIVFVLNLVTSDLDEQITNLKRAEALGIPIERVELGNELYMDIEVLVLEKYPDVIAYATEANRWAAALKVEFPGVQVAAVSSANDSAPRGRSAEWNKNLLPLLSKDIDATVIHIYTSAGVGPDRTGGTWAPADQQQKQYEHLQTAEGVEKMLAQPFIAWHNLQRFSELPQDREIWLTEFNMFDRYGPARGTWAQGLMMSSFLYNFLATDNLNLVCYHNLAGGPLFTAIFWDEQSWQELAIADLQTPPYTLAATGQALALFGEAMTGMTEATQLTFSPSPTATVSLIGERPTLFGWRFANGEKASFLLVNQSQKPYTVDVSALAAKSLPYRQLSAEPATYIVTPESLNQQRGKFTKTLTLKAYSMTLISE